ncbi:MAG: uncharacterized protein A8A55_1269 [Amphiamblys sp. WSBS2006]|nr:MAG: uncharacterized protein A8A55_1269 [Amphiamblys sp. WSBS2006]
MRCSFCFFVSFLLFLHRAATEDTEGGGQQVKPNGPGDEASPTRGNVAQVPADGSEEEFVSRVSGVSESDKTTVTFTIPTSLTITPVFHIHDETITVNFEFTTTDVNIVYATHTNILYLTMTAVLYETEELETTDVFVEDVFVTATCRQTAIAVETETWTSTFVVIKLPTITTETTKTEYETITLSVTATKTSVVMVTGEREQCTIDVNVDNEAKNVACCDEEEEVTTAAE